jgi:hypothetical protein
LAASQEGLSSMSERANSVRFSVNVARMEEIREISQNFLSEELNIREHL